MIRTHAQRGFDHFGDDSGATMRHDGRSMIRFWKQSSVDCTRRVEIHKLCG
jgi:hypothetical protein